MKHPTIHPKAFVPAAGQSNIEHAQLPFSASGRHFLTVAALLILTAAPAFAWKPSTHVYLALKALAEVNGTTGLDGLPKQPGHIVVYRMDHQTGEIYGRVGQYGADPDLLEALGDFRDAYIAGILGPDAYPDIATGQTRIHVEEPRHTNLWLEHLWEQGASKSDEIRAFVIGYLVHGAGDMFMHTFVNHYTGGPFTFKTLNGERHYVLENYIGNRAPKLSPDDYNIDLSADVFEFVYETLTDARAGTYLGDHLLIEQPLTDPMGQASVPRLFSSWRNVLQAHVDWYDGEIADYDERIDDVYEQYEEDFCDGLTCEDEDRSVACAAACVTAAAAALPIAGEKDAFILLHGPNTEFTRGWIAKIDEGLRAWPEFSHDIATHLVFSPDGMDLQAARDRADQYRNEYLLEMLGAPSFAGDFLLFVEATKELLGFNEIEEQLQMMREQTIDAILLSTYGMTAEEVRERFVSPAALFDEVLNLPGYTFDTVNQEEVHPITLADLNQNILGLPDLDGFGDDEWDEHAFAPAYNTMLMTKLIMLSDSARVRLCTDLGVSDCSNTENVMLGFIRSLDDDNQWRNNPPMIFGDCAAYAQIFKRQQGEDVECPSARPLAVPAIDPASGTFSAPREVTLAHEMPEASIYYTISEVDAPHEPNPADSRTRLYTQPFTVSAPLTGPTRPFVVRARAFRDGYLPSESAISEITIDARATAPQIDPAAGDFIEPLEVRLFPAPGTTVFYTLNGETPDYNSQVYTAPIQLNKGVHDLKAVAYQIQFGSSEVVSATFNVFDANTERADVPELIPRSSGDFVDEVEVSMITYTQGAEIRYTLAENGVPEEPTASSTLYTGPFTLGLGDWYVRAVAFKDGLFPSEMNQRNYRVDEPLGVTLLPEFSPNGGTFYNDVEVSIAAATDPATQGVQIFYTTDASEPEIDPQTAGNYSGPFDVTRSLSVKAQATRRFFAPSEVAVAQFRLEVAAPEIAPGGGVYADGVDVALTTITDGATIRYTLDGSDPHEESTEYTGPFLLDETATVRARAYRQGYFISEDVSANFVVQPAAAPAVVQQPSDVSVVVGEPALFAVSAQGLPAPAVQWQFNGADLVDATDDTLRIAAAQPADAGTYRAVLTSSSGAVTTREATLSVNPTPVAPVVVTQPVALQVKQGEAAMLSVSISGTPEPTYVWHRNGQPLMGQTAAMLSYDAAQLVHAGDYFVVASNSAGSVTSDTVSIVVEAETSIHTVDEDELPRVFELHQNYPNPFNPTTTIPFAVPEAGPVSIRLFDATGRLVAVLADEDMASGRYELVFNAEGLASGAYFYQMQSGSFLKAKMMLLVR